MKDNKRKLYDALSKDYDMGSFEQFSIDIDNEEKRRKLYDATSKDYDFGDFDSFSKQLGYEKQAPAAEPVKPVVGKPVEAEIPQAKETPVPQVETEADPSFPMFDDKPNPPLYESKEDFLQQTNRQQVAELTPKIDSLLNDAQGRKLAKKANDSKEAARKGFLANLSHAMATSGGSPTGPAGGGIGHSEVPLDQEDLDNERSISNLQSAKRAITNAQRIIEEADHNAQEGTFGKWLERSFFAGAARGFGQKAFDVENWDMGLSEMEDATALYSALNAFDEGKQLTDEQMIMLDAKAIELATNAYFGSHVGRGYKAGQVTAESLPFMIEMCINPASAMGKSAQSQLTRYAIKRFGKQTVRKNAGKFTAAKVATRVVGDVAGAATMAATTGAVRTMADAAEREAGHIQFDTDEEGNSAFAGHTEGDDFPVALAKAFAGTAIENYSEMVGNYFAPVLGAAGKGVSKGLDKIGLGNVSKFLDDVAMSDVGRLVTDFEKHAQWNGLIGEYAEEVVGNIMNALIVGDMTLDRAEGTGVFNLDQNIDTFLGVALLGGAISSIKTTGYIGEKYAAKRNMKRADALGASLFGEENWSDIHDVLYEGNEEATEMLSSVLTDPEMSDEKKRAVLDYAASVQKFRGAWKGAEKKHMEEPESLDTDLETSFDNGYSLEEPQELNDAKLMYDYQRSRMIEGLGFEETAVDDNTINWQSEAFYYQRSGEEDKADVILSFLNAKATYEGVIQHVRDDIAGKIEASDMAIDSHTHNDGYIHPATLTTDRKVYLVNGSVTMQEDGKAVDRSRSDESVIIRDAETGKLEFVSSHDIQVVDDVIDPAQEKAMMRQQISQATAQEAADKIDGVLPFMPGDTYTGLDENGGTHTITVVADENGIYDNGDGTVNVSMDGSEPVVLPKELISAWSQQYNVGRAAEFDRQRQEHRSEQRQAEQQRAQPQRVYEFNDLITIKDENGNPVRGQISAPFNEGDGKYEIYTESPVNGHKSHYLTKEELDSIVIEHNGEAVEPVSPAEPADNSAGNDTSPVADSTSPTAEQPSALSRIPVNEQGVQVFESAPAGDTWSAFVEMSEGDKEAAMEIASGMLANAQEAFAKAEKNAKKTAKGATPFEISQAIKARKVAIESAKKNISYWESVVGYEEAQAKQAEEEKLRERRLRMAEARRIQQQKGRYSEEDKQLGDHIDFRDYVMRTLARGGVRLKWSDSPDGVIKGLASHLGFKGNQSEQAQRIWLLSNEEGLYPEAAAEALLQGYADTFGITDGYAEDITGLSTMDAFGEMLDVILRHGNSHRGMFDAAAERHTVAAQDMDDYAEGLKQHNLEMEAEANGMTVEEWQTYLEVFEAQMQETFDSMSDEEFNSIFTDLYSQDNYETGRTDTGVREPVHEGQRREEGDPGSSPMVLGEESDFSGTILQSSEEQEEPPIFEQSGFSHVPAAETSGEFEVVGDLPTDEEFAAMEAAKVQAQVEEARSQVDPDPTQAQKEAGNYRKGHVKIDGLDITIENPKGGIRKGTDKNGNQWQTEMANDYGYIRGSESVDGDHIDIFLSDNPTEGKVYVVDQINPDTQEFDEHKVMYGFNSVEEAKAAYLANYTKGWKGLGNITEVSKDEFRKWLDSSHRKTKPFSEYSRIKAIADRLPDAGARQNLSKFNVGDFVRDSYTGFIYRIKKHGRNGVTTLAILDSDGNEVSETEMNTYNNPRFGIAEAPVHDTVANNSVPNKGYSVEPAQYTTKKGKVLEMFLVKFDAGLSKDQQRAAKELAKVGKGWYDRAQDGFMMRSEESARELADTILNDEDAVTEAQPVSMADIQALNNGDMSFTEPQQPKEKTRSDEYHPVWQYSIHVDTDGYTTISRDDVSSGYPIGDARFRHSTDSPEEMLDILRNPLNGMQEVLDAVGVTLENKIKTRELDRQIKEERRREYEALRTNGINGYKIGEEVMYQGERVKIYDFEEYGDHRPVLDTGLAPVMYTVGNWEDISKIDAKPVKPQQIDVEGLIGALNQHGEAKLSDHAMPDYSELIFSSFGKPFTANDGKHSLRIKNIDGAKRTVIADVNTASVGGENLTMSFDEIADILNSDNWEEAKPNPSGNKLVTDERYAELKERMRKKLGGQMNIGIDPEILAIGTEMAVYHIEKGARKFIDFAKGMIEDLGDMIRPYLKAFYNGARELPEVAESGLADEMTPYDEVRTFDLSNFGKSSPDAFATAEHVVKEQEVAKQVEVAQERIKKTRQKPKKSKESSVSSEAEMGGGLFAEAFEEADNAEYEAQREFVRAVMSDMLAALDSDTKPYRSILDIRKRASGFGMEVDNEGRSDILLQELVEDGLVRAARTIIGRHGRVSRRSFDLICKLYEMQPTIAARSSNRIKMQQYSTPLPMAWVANRFAMANKSGGKVLEPTAGNGMLVFTVPVEQVHANELDETRLANLREQGFAQVTQQDATEQFEGGPQYDAIIANPPFGKSEAREYDGKPISGLDPQITLNALASMKDDGRAAIIIGGNMEYAGNGGIKSMKSFFTYLYDHYNVKGVVDMSGSMYAKQGTTFPTRMILIEGRRSEEERAQTAVYPPVESMALRKAENFDDLYEIVDVLLNSSDKTNGTEVLRSQGGRHLPDTDNTSRNSDRVGHQGQSAKNDARGSGTGGRGRTELEGDTPQGGRPVLGEHRQDPSVGKTGRRTDTVGRTGDVGGRSGQRTVGNGSQPVDRLETQRSGLGLAQESRKRELNEEKLPYRPHNTAFSLESVAPAAMVEAMDRVLSQIEEKHGNIDEFIRSELGYSTIEEAHNALAAEQMDSVAMAIYQMKQGQALIIGDQTGVGKGRQMAALIRWAVNQGEKPIFITQKADLFSDIYRDLVDIGSGDLKPFIFNSPSAKENKGEMVDSSGKVVHKGLSDAKMKKVLESGILPDEYDFAVLTYSQVNTGDEVSQQEANNAAKKSGRRAKKSKSAKNGKPTPKATFLRGIAENNYLFLDESHTAAGSSNTGLYLQSIIKSAKAVTFASATFAKRPDTMPLYAIRTAMSQAKVEPEKMIEIIEKGGVTLQEIMSRELTNAGQMVRRERDMTGVITDWKTITDEKIVRRARENYDRTIAAFNAIIKFQDDYVKPMIAALDQELAVYAESAGIKRGTDKLGVENVPFASKTYNYTKQLMLALKVDAIVDEVAAEIEAGRHPVIALESTMESSIKDYSIGEIIEEPTFSASLLKGLETVMQYTVKDENGKDRHERYLPHQLGPAGEKAYYELQDFIRESTTGIFISPLDAIIEGLHTKGYKVGELTGRDMYVERNDDGSVVVRKRTDKDKKRMQREFNNGTLDVLILNKSASTGISLHASEKFSDQRQRSMIIAQPLSDINDYMQMIGRIDRTGQVHRGYYINLGLPVPAENRFLMMLSTKLKSLNANTTTSQDSESNDVDAPDLLNKYGSQVVVEYLRDNPEIYERMGAPLKGSKEGSGKLSASQLDEYTPQEDDARKVTGYVALLPTKEQEDFYDDVIRRYNDLIRYLNDTGTNDLKITVMPLRAVTIDRRVSSEGIDPNGNNPFARNSFVERVEMDVLRKPLKASDIRRVIDQINKGTDPGEYMQRVLEIIDTEDEARLAAEEARHERAKAKAIEDIEKQREKIQRQQKRTEEEKAAAIEKFITETNEKVEARHTEGIARLNAASTQLLRRLRMFEVGKAYLVPENLESGIFDFASPAIFCGYKTKDSKITASTTLAVFATLDGRRRVEVKLSQGPALLGIERVTNDNWDVARQTTLDNWDSQIPTETRKVGYIMTGNILQAIADTQDERGGYPGQLISYTDMEGNIHDGILMPDKWNASMLKTSGAPLTSRMQQIREYLPIESHDGKVQITGSKWIEMYYLSVPKTKKDGAIFYENAKILKLVHGHGFYPSRGQLRADISAENIEAVVKELTRLGVKVKEEIQEDDNRYRDADEDIASPFYPEEIAAMETPILHSKGSFKNFKEAEMWARTNLQGKSETNEFTGDSIRVGRDSIDKMLSEKAHRQSVSIPVHLSALQSVLDFIRTGIPAEIHADKDGRDFDVMRLYNAFEVDGKIYRVKSTVKKVRQGDKYYTYEVQEMELIEERRSDRKGEGETPHNPDNSINSITGAKLLKGVKKTNSDEYILPKEDSVLSNTVIDDGENVYRIREDEPPVNTGIGYKVFYLKDGKLYPPMVANPDGADTPTGVWLDADAAPVSGQSKTGRPQVKAGGRGTQGGGGQLSYRPGWHLGEIPYALQFNRLDSETGGKELFPKDFVWAEVEYANDVDYQQEAMSYGYNENGNFRHSYAGLPRVPENGSYTYRTNPNPETDPWIITGAMKVNRLLTPSEVDEMVREAGREPQKRQRGAVTDEQIQKLNEDIARRNQDTPESMRQAAESLAKSLGVNVRFVTDTNELTSDNARKQKRMRNSKGWLNTTTGDIVVVLPNNHSVADIEATILHEIVGHKGLREVVGKEQFEAFLDKVFHHASKETRAKIVELSKSRNWDHILATEEYIARLAEEGIRTRENRSFWEVVRDFFTDMISRAKIALGFHINDNDLRYMLWRSYQMQHSKGAMGVAEDVAMKQELGVGDFRHRDGGPAPTSSGLARSIYEDAVRITDREGKKTRTANLKHRLRESYQDSMLALKKLQEAILAETGNSMSANENAYIAENRMSSQNKGQAEIYMRDFYKPLQEAVSELTRQGASYEDIVRYLIAKHGLERNLVFSKRDAEAEGGTWDGSVSRDYSGLTDLTGSKDNFTDLAEDMVRSFESSYDTANIWSRINAATKETLRKSYESGLMTKETYEKVRDMFQYYIPLRGWESDVAADEYEYLSGSRPMLSPAVKAAEGRSSVADDPIATIGHMAESSIIQGNRNVMKQKLLNFVLNNPTNLATVSEQWYVLDAATGNWEARNPVIPEDATADEVAAIVEQFEADMESLKTARQATKVRDGLRLGKHATKYEGQEHCIRVRRGGKEFCIYVNGNPRAAQAVNGLTNPDASDSSLYRAAKAVKNFMARMFTSQNPAFVVTNLCRDVIWAGTAVAVKEDKAYIAQYTRNIAGAFMKAKLPVLLRKFQNGTLDMSSEVERYFEEFIKNGGETGFTQLNTVEDYKRDIERFLKEADRNGITNIPTKAWRGLWGCIEFMNRCAEDTTRFMVYMTSRQMGRSVADSVYDAKEITVNFNKKGSGGFGASVMNFAYIFFNATIQGLANFGKMLYHHPGKTAAALSTFTMAGMLIPLLAVAMQAMFGDDDEDSYWDLPEWVRRNNLVFFVPWSDNGYLTIPLPHELRPFFGMGELAFSCLSGKEDVEDAIAKGVQGFSGLLPLDYTGNAGNIAVNFTPTIAQPFAQLVVNKDYFGKPIYKKNDYNELDPEWTKAYKGTNAWLVNATKWLNEISGGDNVKSGAIDLNPAQIEHLFESYLGGVGKTLNKSAKTISMLWDEEMREWRNVPVASSFYQEAEERTTGSQLNREYFDYKEEHDEIEHRISGYKKQIRMGAMEYAEILNDFIQSPEFKRYAELKGYVNAVSKLNSSLKYADKTQREEIEKRIAEIKQTLVDELHEDRE